MNMRKIIFAVLLLLTIKSQSQVVGYTKINSRYQWLAGMFDTSLHVPRYNGTPVGRRTGASNQDGAIAIDTTNNRLYIYSGGAWLRMAAYSELPSPVNIYNTDGTLTGDRTLTGGGNDLIFTGVSLFSVNAASESINLITSSASALSSINIKQDTVFINPHLGRIKIDTLAAGVGTKAIRYNPSTGMVTYADTTTGGGGGGGATVGTYSTRIGLTPSDGDEFFQTDIGRDAPDGKYYYLNSKWHYMPLRKESLRDFWEDFQTVQQNGGYGDDGLIYWTGNSGTISYNNTTVPGVARFSTSTTTNGFSGFYGGALNNSGAWINLSNGAAYLKSYVNIPTLSDATNRYTFRIGLANGLLGDFSSGVYLEYNESASANWKYKTANFTTRTDSTSSVAVATGWHTLEILVNAGGTSVQYWLNGTSLGTITTNIPGNGNGLNPQMLMIKSAGTTARFIDVDYVKAWQRLTTEIQ